MTNHKFTDEEIIKALEWCIQSASCENCGYRQRTNKVDVCPIKSDALDLIKRQKAESERLRKEKYIFCTVDYCSDDLAEAREEIDKLKFALERANKYGMESDNENARLKAEREGLIINMNAARLGMIVEHERLKTARDEAIKEFAERLKQTAYILGTITGYQHHVIDVSDIDNLVEEMTEEKT